MSEKFLKFIFLIFGFCFFLEILWMIGVNFGIAEPFCLVVGKKPLKCSEQGEIRAVAKQFCLGQKPFGWKKKIEEVQDEEEDTTDEAQPEHIAQQPHPGIPQGYITQDQMRAQKLLLQQQHQQQMAQQ